MRTIEIALDLHEAGIPVAGVDSSATVKAPATTDRRAICANFRDGEPLVPAAVLGNGLVVIRFNGDEPYRKTVENIRARDGSLFGNLAVMRSPSGKWTVMVRVQGGAAPAGEVLARDKAGEVLVELLAAGDLVVFGDQDGPVWRQGGVKSIPTLPMASVALLLEAARSVNEDAEVEPEPVIKATNEGATAEAATAPIQTEAPQAEARPSGPDLADLQTPAGFLALLWPDATFDGWMTFFTKTPSGKTATAAFHRSKLTDAEKWAMVQAKTANVWHGVGLRREKPAKGKRGDAEDVIAIPGLWFDLDVKGPGHSEQNLPATFEDALDFIKSLPLKPTVMVNTGGGWQLYWLLPEPMRLSTKADRNRARAVSERWHRFIIALGKDHGWKLDNTGDLPRVLRLPGSYNRKTDQPVLVTVPPDHVDLTARYDLAAIEAVLPPVETPQAEPDHAEDHDDVADADIKLILAKCAFVRHCRDDAAGLPEPEWYALLSVVCRCKDGQKLAHDWSKAHPKYNPTETDAKLKQAMEKAGPRTCESIRADFGTYCNGCPAGVKSPIVLGCVDRLPYGFQAKANGIYYRVEDNDGNIDLVRVCSPIKVLALTCDDEDRAWGRYIAVQTPKGKWNYWAMPTSLMAGSGEAYRSVLWDMGLIIAPGKGNQRLHSFLADSHPHSYARCVKRTGWHDDKFVFADVVYGQGSDQRLILQAEYVENLFRTSGTLAEWQENIAKYCVGNCRLALAVSSAFAAPLLYITGAESGGFHYYGDSSVGKSTAAVVAGSVCGGGGIRGYVRQWRATANGLEGIAAAHTDCLLVLDEIAQATGKEVGETIYMFANETGKSRADRGGAARKPFEWRILFFSTGEIPISDKIMEDARGRVMAGQAVRAVDIPGDVGAGHGLFEELHGSSSGKLFSEYLKAESRKIYGTALRAFLEKLTGDFKEASRVVPELIKAFERDYCPSLVGNQVQRVCKRFALLAAAGEIAVHYGVLPWPKGEATQAAARCFQDWLALRGGTGASEIQAGLAQVRAFFQAHGSSRFETWGDRADETKTINRAGFRRKDELTGAWEYYVPATVFKGEIARGHDDKRLVKELVERGLIIPGTNGQPASTHRIPGQPVARYYRFAPSIVSDDSDSSKNTVTTVTTATPSNDAGSERNRAEEASVTTVTKTAPVRELVTAVTAKQSERLQEKVRNSSCVTGVTAVTAENDNPGEKTPAIIDMKPTEGTALWAGPSEVEI